MRAGEKTLTEENNPKAIGTISVHYTSGSKERREAYQTFGTDQKPIKFRHDLRAE